MCPGELISITCAHDNVAGELTRWAVYYHSTTSTCTARVVSHVARMEDLCGPFTITMISDISGPTLTSTAQTTATESLNGTVVECLAGGLSSSPQVGNVTLNVKGEDLC